MTPTPLRPSAPMDVMRLPRNGSARFDAPLELRVLDGTLWVTVDGRPDDLVLEPGSARRIDSGRVLAFALGGAARLAVREAPIGLLRARWQRLRSWGARQLAPLALAAAPGAPDDWRSAGGRP